MALIRVNQWTLQAGKGWSNKVFLYTTSVAEAFGLHKGKKKKEDKTDIEKQITTQKHYIIDTKLDCRIKMYVSFLRKKGFNTSIGLIHSHFVSNIMIYCCWSSIESSKQARQLDEPGPTLTWRTKVIGCWPMAWESPILAFITSVKGCFTPYRDKNVLRHF